MDKIAVLIPCYNESKTIEKVIKDLNFIASLHRIPAGRRCRPVGFLIITFWLTIPTIPPY